MGEVYEATDLVLERQVALKILPPDLVSRADRVHRFVQEAKRASALNHPHIVTVHEIGQVVVEGRQIHYIAMELVQGTTLQEEIHRLRAPLKRLLTLLAQVADALAKAHATGIVHRDLKPQNIMVTGDGYAKVVDFGLAKLFEPRIVVGSSDITADRDSITIESGLLGTVGYMAPELIDRRPADHRADIFSFGCIVYEAITRERAFDANSDVDVLYKILHESPAPITGLSEDVPPELQRLVERCLEKSPDERYQSLRDVALELRGIERRFSSESGGSTLRAALVQSPFFRRRFVWASVLLAVITSVIALALLKRPFEVEKAPVMRALVRWPSNEYDCRISPALSMV